MTLKAGAGLLSLGHAPRRTLFSSVASPIQVMRNEQEGTRRGLARLLRALEVARAASPSSFDFAEIACTLASLERDLEAHVALEQDALFPRAIEAERRIATQNPG